MRPEVRLENARAELCRLSEFGLSQTEAFERLSQAIGGIWRTYNHTAFWFQRQAHGIECGMVVRRVPESVNGVCQVITADLELRNHLSGVLHVTHRTV